MSENNNNLNDKNGKSNENFFSRLIDVIDTPLFLYLMITLAFVVLSTQEFYLEYMIYGGILSVVLGIFFKGWAGFRAAKNKESNIKPFVAGFFIALFVSIFSLVLSVVTIVYFPTNMFGQDNSMAYVDTNYDEENFEEGELIEEDIEDFEDKNVASNEFADFENMGQGGWDDPLLNWTLIGGAISLVFSCLFGALFGFVGGLIGRD